MNQTAEEQTTAEQNNQATFAGANSVVNSGEMNLSNTTINLGTISGTVTHTINQLRETTTPDAPQLADLLTQLQAAISADANLSETDKVDALAELGQNPQTPDKEGIARRAMKMLKGTISTLPDTAKLAEACSKLFPLIAKVLGLPL